MYVGNQPLAQVEYPGPGGEDGHAYYFHTDALGLPRAMTSGSGQVVWSAATVPNGEVKETVVADAATGRTVVTNLRLPGQYDERLLAGVGLQGPYYNWNRWYLPSMGRYMELDPIALEGGFNGDLGPDWYGYAGGNPLTWFDVDALSKTQNLWGNDEAYQEFVDAAKKGRKYVTEVYEKYKAMYDRGEMGGERWKNIRAWWKTAKDGRILRLGPVLIIIDPKVICGPNLERCRLPDPQCRDGV